MTTISIIVLFSSVEEVKVMCIEIPFTLHWSSTYVVKMTYDLEVSDAESLIMKPVDDVYL